MKLIKSFPFSIAMVSILVITGILVQTHVGELPQDVHSQFVHSPRLLIGGDVYRTSTSVFFTVGGWRFYVSIFMLSVLFLQFCCATIHVPEQGHLSSSNLAHLIAFPLGLAMRRWMKPVCRQAVKG